MSRIQLALNVADLDAAVDFYANLFGAEAHKRMPGYANFAIADPPLKLVLIENPAACAGTAGKLNHLGVEVMTPGEVAGAAGRLADLGLETESEDASTCCYAVQDKVWVRDPDGAPWEFYAVLADAPASTGLGGDERCCPPPTHEPVDPGAAAPVGACC